MSGVRLVIAPDDSAQAIQTNIDITNATFPWTASLQVRDRVHCNGDLSFNGRLLKNGLPLVSNSAATTIPVVQTVGPLQESYGIGALIYLILPGGVNPVGFQAFTNTAGNITTGINFNVLAGQEGTYSIGFGVMDTPERTGDESVVWELRISHANGQVRKYNFVGSGLATVYLKSGDIVTPIMGTSARTLNSTSKFMLLKVATV